MCDVPLCENTTPLNALNEHSEIVVNSNDDNSSSDDDSTYGEDIDYVDASPPDVEIVSLEVVEIVDPEVGRIDDDILLTIKDDILREKLLNVNLLIAKIDSLRDNPTPSSDVVIKSTSTFSNLFLEETNTFDNSIPESETFRFNLEEIGSGSPTTHSELSLPDYKAFYIDNDHFKERSSGSTTTHVDFSQYDSFIFDLSNDQFPPADRSDFNHEEFADELTHIMSLPNLECFKFKIEPDPRDLTSIDPRIRKNVSMTNVNVPLEDDQSSLFAYVVWIFLSFLTYPVVPPYLLSTRNEDTIFDPGISIYHSFMPDVSHRSGTFMKFNDFPDCEDSQVSTRVSHPQLHFGNPNKSSVENLIPIPSESEGIPDSVCDVPLCNNPTPLEAFKEHSETIIDSNDDNSSSDDDYPYGEDIEYVDASPPDVEIVSLEVVEIIDALRDNPTPSSEVVIKSTSTFPNLFLEETNTFDNSIPESETFRFNLEEISSGKCFTTNVNVPLEDDQSSLFAYVVWIFLAFLTYPVVPPYLLSTRNEDTIFDPGISMYHSFMPDDFPDCEDSRACSIHKSFTSSASFWESKTIDKGNHHAEQTTTLPPTLRKNFVSNDNEGRMVKKYIIEIQGTFLVKIRDDAFNANVGETAFKHIVKFLKVVGPIKISGLTQDRFRLSVFPVSLVGAASEWFTKECIGSITTWDNMVEKFIMKFHHLSDHNEEE
ncbi:hypothetical protein Tco_0976705 [Tanacetum coccineum]|uniref:Reverse transcriptase domain-containing protein n=1 Tax=Tanacetum coccineum TaxID=301880 RepID=A0ABQ5EI18_9ASTR